MGDKRTLPEMEELGEQIGELVYNWGSKRIHGRVWSHLYLSKDPVDAADLVKSLNISKALVSISLRELLDFEVIQSAGKSARGTQLYRTNPDLSAVMMAVLRQRERRLLSRVQAACEGLGRVSVEERGSNGISEGQIIELGKLVQSAMTSLEKLIASKPGELATVCPLPIANDDQDSQAKAL